MSTWQQRPRQTSKKTSPPGTVFLASIANVSRGLAMCSATCEAIHMWTLWSGTSSSLMDGRTNTCSLSLSSMFSFIFYREGSAGVGYWGHCIPLVSCINFAIIHRRNSRGRPFFSFQQRPTTVQKERQSQHIAFDKNFNPIHIHNKPCNPHHNIGGRAANNMAYNKNRRCHRHHIQKQMPRLIPYLGRAPSSTISWPRPRPGAAGSPAHTPAPPPPARSGGSALASSSGPISKRIAAVNGGKARRFSGATVHS